jgi:sigma-B regulation protein RsbU (phosphoserine phosphatase)
VAVRVKVTLLNEAVRALAGADSLEQVQQLVRGAARALADSQGATIVLLDAGKCFYADEDAISPLWKGQRFPVAECISGWSMLNRQAAVIPDIRLDDRIPQHVYRPTFVRSLAMVPIRESAPLGAIGAYWAKPHRPATETMTRLRDLAAAAGTALERIT